MYDYDSHDLSSTATRRRFSFLGAFEGGHRPSRVAAYGIGLLLAYAAAAVAALKYGAAREIVFDLEHFGATPAVASAIPLTLLAGFGLLWFWFAVSLWRCAPNAATRRGAGLARAVATMLGFALAAVVLLVAVPGLR